MLIVQALKAEFEYGSDCLPGNRAVVVQTASTGTLSPLTCSITHKSGWRWRIPLQNRVGNGLVFSSEFVTLMSEGDAASGWPNSVEGEVLTDLRVIKYKSGQRKLKCEKNCVALGLSTDFVERLGSVSIRLYITGSGV